MLDVFDRVLVTSSKDRNHFLKLRSSKVLRAEISILPNGVDLDYFQYQPQPNGRSKVIVMTGKMSYHANISMVRHFYENIYPSVQAGHSDVELWIVGKDPSPEILAMRSDRSVTVTGTVSDIRPYLAKATLAVAPVTYGAGIQNKVLEAMAVGTPVVSSPEAISALGVEPERDLSVAANPEEFARKIIRLIDRTEARSSLSQAGRQYVENHHSWETIAEQLEGIYCELISA